MGTAPLLAGALSSPVRSRLLALLRERGPSTQTELGREIDAAPATAAFHLRKLESAGLARRAGTRPGPRGTVERLFALSTRGRRLKFATRHGTAEDVLMRRSSLSEVLDIHRVASRAILREPGRFFGLSTSRISATPAQFRRLHRRFSAILDAFARGRERAPRNGEERCAVHVGLYPVGHPPPRRT
ncbi:MAG: ArsR family transcriptional [Planctomycetota bacterium]|nr:MAG: ArsR family transcriptional [Planctomycetota bacterium]